jgi:hypothetical protein
MFLTTWQDGQGKNISSYLSDVTASLTRNQKARSYNIDTSVGTVDNLSVFGGGGLEG